MFNSVKECIVKEFLEENYKIRGSYTIKEIKDKFVVDFICSFCDSLKTLKGAPKEIGQSFYCRKCKSLKTLKGAPKKVGGSFHCGGCGTKFTEEDVRKYTNVPGVIWM